jgi:hypothetical protein
MCWWYQMEIARNCEMVLVWIRSSRCQVHVALWGKGLVGTTILLSAEHGWMCQKWLLGDRKISLGKILWWGQGKILNSLYKTNTKSERTHKGTNSDLGHWIFYCNKNFIYGAHTGGVGWGTALPTGRSRVRFLMVSLEFFIDIIPPATLWPWGWLSF